MTYVQALRYLYNLERFGIKLGLENIKKVLRSLDNPQNKLKVIHIAGTNGKGSTAAFIASILREAGYKVGLYTSPHLVDFRERIQVNGKYVAKGEVVRLGNSIRSVLKGECLTYFEFATTMAFLYFKQQKVEFAVVEVGMGGRLDATNIIKKNLVSVITNIDLEHTQYLGRDLKKITFEKCGIIRRNGTVITGNTHKTSIEVIKEICRKKKSVLFQAGKDFQTSGFKSVSREVQVFSYKGIYSNLEDLRIKMLGSHQIDNALCAIATVEVLVNYGYQIKEEHIRKGLEETSWPGRLEFFEVSDDKRKLIPVLVDGAHNPAAIKSLKNYLKNGILKFDKLILIFGVLGDKDIKGMLEEIVPLADIFILTKPNSSRAAEPELVIKELRKYISKKSIILSKDIKRAISKAMSLVHKNDLICITGSLYTVGEARQRIIKSSC